MNVRVPVSGTKKNRKENETSAKNRKKEKESKASKYKPSVYAPDALCTYSTYTAVAVAVIAI